MKLLFFGTQPWAAELLASLFDDPRIEVVGVVTQPDRPSGRAHLPLPSPVKQIAQQKGVPLFEPTHLQDPSFLQSLEDLHADVSLVIAYGRLLPERVLSLTPFGTLNVHPSLLPHFRGPSPVQSAIAAGEEYSGVSIIKIDAQMDHGPILAQERLAIDPEETPETFMKKVVALSLVLLPKTLHAYLSGVCVPKEQEHAHATICKMLSREDGRIDWHRRAEEIERMIRAYHPWPGTWTTYHTDGKIIRVKILRACLNEEHLQDVPGTLFEINKKLLVTTGNGALEIDLLQKEGGPELSAQAFLAGHREWLGHVLD